VPGASGMAGRRVPSRACRATCPGAGCPYGVPGGRCRVPGAMVAAAPCRFQVCSADVVQACRLPGTQCRPIATLFGFVSSGVYYIGWLTHASAARWRLGSISDGEGTWFVVA
jgi:hypothetical protein